MDGCVRVDVRFGQQTLVQFVELDDGGSSSSAGLRERSINNLEAYWRDHFSRTPFWKVARARLVPVVEIVSLPLSILEAFLRTADQRQGWARLLKFLSPITIRGGSILEIVR
jgi:hypothetical protein